MRKFSSGLMALLIASIGFSNPIYCDDDFDGLEGVVILTPNGENDETGINAGENEEGLQLSINEASVEQVDDTYANIILQADLMNWDVAEYQIADAISAKLYYNDDFEYVGKIDFDGETSIGMLVELKGTITFTVPYIVATAKSEELSLELTVLDNTYNQRITLSSKDVKKLKVPFDYNSRKEDELELHLGDFTILDKWNGEEDNKYKWIIQEINLINWSDKTIDIGNALSALLTYKDTYGFEAQVEFPQDKLRPLESITGYLIYHVPLIVTDSKKNDLGLQLKLQNNEWEEGFNIDKTGKIDSWTLLRNVFRFDDDNSINRYDIYADSSTETMWEYDGHIYMIVNVANPSNTYYNREEAMAFCEAMGGHLATITSPEEQNSISDNLEKYAKHKQYWIGGIKNSDQWQWITGEKLTYQNWHPGEPNGNGNVKYMEIYNNGQWDDTYADNRGVKGYICEWDF